MDSEKFVDKLPLNINFTSSKMDVRRMLGHPLNYGGGFTDAFFGYIPIWDNFSFDHYTVHVQYSKDETSIEVVSFESLMEREGSSPE